MNHKLSHETCFCLDFIIKNVLLTETLGATSFVFRGEAVILSGEAAIDLAAHDRSFATKTKKKPFHGTNER